jgi:hypothetical protein
LKVVNEKGISNLSCDVIWVGNSELYNCEAKFLVGIDSTTRKVQFIDKSSGEPDKWEWTFDNEGTSVEQSPIKTFSDTGLYVVGLYITTPTGCRSYAYQMINVGAKKVFTHRFVAKEDTTKTNKSGGYPVDFVGVGMGDNARLKWDFGDGDTDETSESPSHIYESTGDYNVCYTVTDPITGDSSTYCNKISVEGPTKVKQTFKPEGFRIMPNPVAELLNITFESKSGKYEVIITDISGRIVQKESYNAASNGQQYVKLKAGSWEAGSYIVTVRTADNNEYKKVFVKK